MKKLKNYWNKLKENFLESVKLNLFLIEFKEEYSDEIYHPGEWYKCWYLFNGKLKFSKLTNNPKINNKEKFIAEFLEQMYAIQNSFLKNRYEKRINIIKDLWKLAWMKDRIKITAELKEVLNSMLEEIKEDLDSDYSNTFPFEQKILLEMKKETHTIAVITTTLQLFKIWENKIGKEIWLEARFIWIHDWVSLYSHEFTEVIYGYEYWKVDKDVIRASEIRKRNNKKI